MATPSAESPKILCAICNKAKGIYTCRGCSKDFCSKHSIDHRNELSKKLEEITVTHDLIQQKLDQQMKDPQQYSLIEKIKQWEEESIVKIRKVAEKIKSELLEYAIEYTNQMKKDLHSLTNDLRQGHAEDDFNEIDIKQWTQKLEELKKELVNPTTITIEEDPTPLVTNIRIQFQCVSDVFDRVCGAAEIKENGSLVIKSNVRGHTEIRGKNEFNTGIHRLWFLIEQLAQNAWISFGIINKSETMRDTSYNSPSSYGWSNRDHIYAGGSHTSETTTKTIQGDIVELLIDCKQHKIQLKNERANNTMELKVDTNKCPFPWQFHVNLHQPNTHVRILSLPKQSK